jgi:hypothetical protein
MTSTTSSTTSAHISRPDFIKSIHRDDVVHFFKNYPEIDDVFSWSRPETDISKRIRRYVGETFEKILEESEFGKNLDEIIPYGSVESAWSVSTFLNYGDEVEALKDSLQEAIGNCEWFEDNQREEWEEDVDSLRSSYKKFMNDWIQEMSR